MTDSVPHDPGVNPEEEGVPDLQAGSPEAEEANDPQQMPVPVDEPVGADKFGTTFVEQVEGEPLDDRLSQEQPEVDDRAAPEGPETEESGQLSDDPLSWRPANQDSFSTVSSTPGASGEEAAVHVHEDDETGLGLRTDEEYEDDLGGDVTGELGIEKTGSTDIEEMGPQPPEQT